VRRATLAHLGCPDLLGVRQIRLGRSVPLSDEAVDRDEAREGFVRSLVEAVRLTAADLLEVDLRELRSTWLMNGTMPDVVLYDGVTGGAGYAHRIGEDIPIRSLLEGAHARLTCDCAAACRKCLLDYTNQRVWETLDRRPVLAWLEALMVQAGAGDALAAFGAVPWPTPSLAGLKERLAGATEVLLYAPRWLEADEGPEPAARDFIVDLLRASKTVYVGATEKLPAFGTQSAELRELLEHFAPWLRDGSLRLFTAPRPTLLADRFQPRAMAGRSRVWLAGAGDLPLFAGVLAGEIAELPLSKSNRSAEIEGWLGSWHPVDVGPLLAQAEARFRSYQPGEPRDLGYWFAPLADGTIERLRVRDPYALNGERNRRTLARFLEEFARITGDWPPVIEILFMDPEDLQHGDGLSARQQDAALGGMLQALGKPAGTDVRARSIRRARQRDFHDRELVVEAITADGGRRAHRYALSGGIDRFLDSRYECAVTHSVGNADASSTPD
jgi:hypothetical protein